MITSSPTRTAEAPESTPQLKVWVSNQRHDIVPSPEIWFNDGNIVLIAGSVAFKVHRGQLARQSEVFHDLFSIPPPAEQDMLADAVVVELSDSPSDLRHFLRALYDGLYFKKPHASDFPSVAAVLRLSIKYIVEHLRQRCLQRLEADWPSTLIGWDARERKATDENNRYIPRDWCAHPVLVIQLALELDLASLLPAALYDLSRYGPSKIMAGPPLSASQRNGSALALLSSGIGRPHPGSSQERTIKLSRDMLTRVLRGREMTQRFMSTFITQHLHNRPPSPGCLHRLSSSSHRDGPSSIPNPSIALAPAPAPTTATAPALAPIPSTAPHPHNPHPHPGPSSVAPPITCPSRLCHESFYFIMLNVLRSVGGIACGRDADPLYTLVQATEMLSRTDFSDGQRQCALRLCQACKNDFALCARRAREEVWRRVPVWFGLVEESQAKEGTAVKTGEFV